MRWIAASFALCFAGCALLPPATANIDKVLPHFLDEDGRHSDGVGLLERDLYQLALRDEPDRISSIRFDIKWSGAGLDPKVTRLRLEVRGSKAGAEPIVIDHNATADILSTTWTPIFVPPADYEKLGQMESWRVSLWEGDRQVAGHQSFLW